MRETPRTCNDDFRKRTAGERGVQTQHRGGGSVWGGGDLEDSPRMNREFEQAQRNPPTPETQPHGTVAPAQTGNGAGGPGGPGRG